MGRGFKVVADAHRVHKKVVADHFDATKKVTIYADITLPTRATERSAGYDICVPVDIMLLPMQKTMIKTDIKAYMEHDEVLEIHIRSSVGIKNGVWLSNVTGIIDSDFYENEDNDGNISLALINTSGVGVQLKAGQKVAQGIFKKFLVTDDDNATGERVGGVGSTGE